VATYYYLISSLPTLRADQDPPISYDEFLGMCKTAVSPSVYSALEELSLSSDKGPLAKEWAGFYRSFKAELDYQRSIRLGRPRPVPENRDAESGAVISAAIGAENPLEAEKLLMALEFRKLDEMTSLHYFDDWVLMGYAMKLKLIERRRAFDHDDGKEEFTNLFKNIQDQILKV
jgi:hypothetical protein